MRLRSRLSMDKGHWPISNAVLNLSLDLNLAKR